MNIGKGRASPSAVAQPMADQPDEPSPSSIVIDDDAVPRPSNLLGYLCLLGKIFLDSPFRILRVFRGR